MLIIYLSGIDGCGKTTQAQLLVDRLKKCGLSAEYHWLRWEPSIVPLIKWMKRLSGKPDSTGSTKDHIAHTENLHHGRWSALKNTLFSNSFFRRVWLSYATNDYFKSYRKVSQKWGSSYVILDRYLLDFVIDQSLNLSISPNDLQHLLADTALAEIKVPELSIFIDLPAEVGYKRKLDGTPLQYLVDREQLYKNISIDGPVLHVDGTQSTEDIHHIIFQWVYEQIGCKSGH